jgi:hypothetical protein
MKNAHLRFGSLEFVKISKDTQTRIRVRLDRFIGERSREGDGEGHLISVVGSDTEIGAIWAAVTDLGRFTVEGPGLPPISITLGKDAQTFRGTLSVSGRKRPLRHLVAISERMAQSRPGADLGGKCTILANGAADFLLYRTSRRFGLPVLPHWAEWFVAELHRRRAIRPLIGVGCVPVAVVGSRGTFLGVIALGLRRKQISIPEKNGPIIWGSVSNPLFEATNNQI